MSLIGPSLAGQDRSFAVTAARDAIDAVRHAVLDGTLRYRAVIASAGGASATQVDDGAPAA